MEHTVKTKKKAMIDYRELGTQVLVSSLQGLALGLTSGMASIAVSRLTSPKPTALAEVATGRDSVTPLKRAGNA